MIEAFRKADLEAVIYSDVLEYLDRENELAEGLDLERQLLAKLRRGHDPLKGILKTKLLPYQERGAIFAACRGRVVLADDMGLGKTVQALAATEMLRRRRGITRVLVVAPASVKYQWKTEIEKFTGSSCPGDRRIAAAAARTIRLAQVLQPLQLRTGPQRRALHARTGARPHHPR